MQPRSYHITTIVGDSGTDIEDGIKRDFTSMQSGTRLVGGITYLLTDQRSLNIALVLYLATRMVIGWQTAIHLRTSLIMDALEIARIQGLFAPEEILHSDGGA